MANFQRLDFVNLSTWQNRAYVDATRGSDATAVLGRSDRPYATISAAQTAALTAGGSWLIEILPGAYTDTGLVPGDSDATLAYYYHPLTTHTITGSGNLYDWTGDHTGKILYVLGHCRFLANGSTTGKVVGTTYGSTAMYRFHFHCTEILNFNGRVTAMLDIRTGGLGDNGSTIKAEYSLDDSVGQPFYFRIDSKIVYIDGRFIRGIDTDGSGRFVINCDYLERLRNAYNAFSFTTTNVFARYRIKATSFPAIINRRGEVVVMAQKYEVTDGQAPIIQIPANADTADGCTTTVIGGYMRQWSGGSAYPIDFVGVNSKFKLRLHNVHILVENGATESIHAGSAQTIEAIGSLTTNKALSANITVRGATPSVDTNFWTGF